MYIKRDIICLQLLVFRHHSYLKLPSQSESEVIGHAHVNICLQLMVMAKSHSKEKKNKKEYHKNTQIQKLCCGKYTEYRFGGWG